MMQIIRRTPVLRTAFAGPIAIRRAWLDYLDKPNRALFERFEEIVQSDVKVKVDEFQGEFVIGPRSHLLHRILATGHYEPDLVKLFLSHLDPDRDVIDVGANIGFFTVLAARHLASGRVFGAEPTRAAFARLQQNVASNGVADKVILFNGLVSDALEDRAIRIVPGREEYSSVGAMVHPSIAGQELVTETIQAKPLDVLVKEHDLKPGLIKVDVEGAEAMVFAGAEETLKTHRPVVISECSRPLLERNGTSPEAIIALFDRCGYDVHDPHDPRAKPGARDFSDIVAIPRPG